MKVGTDVFAGLSMYSLIRFHVLVGLKARGTSDPRKHLCFGKGLIGWTTPRPGAPRVGSMVLSAGVFAGLARGELLNITTNVIIPRVPL